MSVAQYLLSMFVIIVGVCGGAITSPQQDDSNAAHHQEGGHDQWVERNYLTARHKLFPSGAIPIGAFPRNAQWVVTVQISPPFDELEYRLSLTKTYDGELRASVTIPKGSSVFSQMRALKKQYPDLPLSMLIKKIAVENLALAEKEVPELRNLAERFEVMQVSPVLPDVLIMDHTRYEFWSESQYGQRMEVVLAGFGRDAKKQPHPLVDWAEEFRRLIDSHRKAKVTADQREEN